MKCFFPFFSLGFSVTQRPDYEPFWAAADPHREILTVNDEADVSVCGAQRVLRRAAEHGPVQLGGDPLQNQLPPFVLLSAVQQIPTNPSPGEQRLREDPGLWRHM